MKLMTIGLVALGLAIANTAAYADDIAYETIQSGEFGTVDLNTGVFTDLGSSGQTLSGLAVANGTLYASSYKAGTGSFYSVNPNNGALTLISTTNADYSLFGSTTSGGIYAVDTSGNLYSIDSSTGAATDIGNDGNLTGAWYSLSNNSPNLYLSAGTSLYEISTSTGAAILIGSLGTSQMGAMVFEDGALWGGENSPTLSIATLNTLTGAATTGSAVIGIGSGNSFGLAPYPVPRTSAVPEPTTLSLLGLGFLAGVGFLRRRKAI